MKVSKGKRGLWGKEKARRQQSTLLNSEAIMDKCRWSLYDLGEGIHAQLS